MDKENDLKELPVNWCIAVTVDNVQTLIDWRKYGPKSINPYSSGYLAWNRTRYSNKKPFTEITFDQFKKWILLEPVNKEFIVDKIQEYLPDGHIDKISKETKEIIPEYVECIKDNKPGNQYTRGKIYKVNSVSENWYNITSDNGNKNNGWGKEYFKPSTKEAYNTQYDKSKKELTTPTIEPGDTVYNRNIGKKSVVISNHDQHTKFSITALKPLFYWVSEGSVIAYNHEFICKGNTEGYIPEFGDKKEENININDCENWQIGDVLECIESDNGISNYYKGSYYIITESNIDSNCIKIKNTTYKKKNNIYLKRVFKFFYKNTIHNKTDNYNILTTNKNYGFDIIDTSQIYKNAPNSDRSVVLAHTGFDDKIITNIEEPIIFTSNKRKSKLITIND